MINIKSLSVVFLFGILTLISMISCTSNQRIYSETELAYSWGYTDEYSSVNMNIGYPYYGFYNIGYGNLWGYPPFHDYYDIWYWQYGNYWGYGGEWIGYYPYYDKRNNYSIRGYDNIENSNAPQSNSNSVGGIINDNTKIIETDRTYNTRNSQSVKRDNSRTNNTDINRNDSRQRYSPQTVSPNTRQSVPNRSSIPDEKSTRPARNSSVRTAPEN